MSYKTKDEETEVSLAALFKMTEGTIHSKPIPRQAAHTNAQTITETHGAPVLTYVQVKTLGRYPSLASTNGSRE